MGLAIHYSGSFANQALLPEMISEVSEIAGVFGWKYTVFENEFPADVFGKESYNPLKIYGICVIPPESEPVWFTFLSNGRMSAPHLLQLWGAEKDPERKEYLYMPWTKTQYAGIEQHIKVIQLFRYINLKYLSSFTMTDEGDYWETDDVERLKVKFAQYNFLVGSFGDALENSAIKVGESLEDFIKRIAGKVHEKFREKEGDAPDE